MLFRSITFSGSIIAFLKLRGIMSGSPITFKGQHYINLLLSLSIIVLIFYLCKTQSDSIFWIIIEISFLLGLLLIIPIGGADMPVVISMLNSYSGWAACGIGFTLSNNLLIITGALVGASGAILSYIMSKGMNRSILSVVLGGFGGAGFLGIVLGAVGKSVNPANRFLFAGVIMAAGSFGQFVITPIINTLIHNIGWASSLYYIVYISLFLLICSYFLSFSGKTKPFSKDTDQTISQALKQAAANKNFKLLTIGFFVCGFHVTFVGTHLTAFLEDQNLPYWLSGWALALIGLFNILGTLMSGYLSGRIAKKNVLSAIYSLRSILFLFFILSPMNEISVLLFSSILGLLWLSTVPPTNGIIADIFGPKYTSMLFVITLLSHNIGSFLG